MTRAEQVFYWTLGNAIMRARKAAKLTQVELAARIGLSRPSIANIESGRQAVLAHVLAAIAGALGVETAALLPPGTR